MTHEPDHSSPAPGFTRLCGVADLPSGKAKRFVVGGEAIALFHTAEGFFAVADACSHQGVSLAFGLLEGCAVACPRHGALFDVRNGSVLSLPAVRGVRAYDVVIEQDGVYVATSPRDSAEPALLRLP